MDRKFSRIEKLRPRMEVFRRPPPAADSGRRKTVRGRASPAAFFASSSQKPFKIFCKISSSSASNKVKGGRTHAGRFVYSNLAKLLRSGIPLRALPLGQPAYCRRNYAGDFFQGIAIPESISRQEQPEKLALCHRKESMAVRAAKEKRSADRRCHASFRSIRRSGGSDCAAG